MRTDYAAFVAGKRASEMAHGFDAEPAAGPLFPHQRDIVRWALRLGRAAIFADTGLGKTRMQLAWASEVARHAGGRVLLLAPLAVGAQTIEEAEAIGVNAGRVGSDADVHVINYDRLHTIDATSYVGVVLDESSILKSVDGKTRTMLIESFADTCYRLACTATPAPNDYTELGNHAAFLGICTREEMLAEYFVHDGGSTQDWRIKGHARRDFWRWVASWGVLIRRPSDLGHADAGYALPPLTIGERVVKADHGMAHAAGLLFADAAGGIGDQRAIRKASIGERAAAVADLVASEPDESWLVWGELNDECDAIESLIPGAVQVKGSDDPDVKADRLLAFARGEIRVLVTKPSIAGFGMNWQRCARQVFAGVGYSYEAFYQAVRRCWRFGQTRPVVVTIVRTDADAGIAASLREKAARADAMAAEMLSLVSADQLASVRGIRPGVVTKAEKAVTIPSWLVSEDT
jgi:hypothetical protein